MVEQRIDSSDENGAEEEVIPEKPSELPLWLGGFFSVGGSLYFDLNERELADGQVVTYAYPIMRYGDDDLGRLTRLRGILGGRVMYSHSRGTGVWELRGRQAVNRAGEFLQYAPSRYEVITAFARWLEVTGRGPRSRDVRAEIGAAVSSRHLTPERGEPFFEMYCAYIDLLAKPDFLAGVIDGRGNFPRVVMAGRLRANMKICTRNGPLVYALRYVFGGKSISEHPGGIESLTIMGEQVLARQSVYEWAIFDGSLCGLMEGCGPLRMRTFSPEMTELLGIDV